VAADAPIPLATSAQILEGAFNDLMRQYTVPALANVMIEATRACEGACDRLLAPFTGLVETQRADSLDVEDALDSYVPLDPAGQLGMSRAQSLGSTLLVRHFWVREFPPRNPSLWSGSISALTLLRSYSGSQSVDVSTLQFEPDTGHARFRLGSFVPPGTTIQCTYSGGYATVPADLVRACKYMAASIATKELDPAQQSSGHNPDALLQDALDILDPYMRK
jgi:hypothetical protein